MQPEFERALTLALKRLRFKDLFESEVSERLRHADCDETTVSDVIKYLRERKLLDDERTITNLLERRTGRRSLGKARLRSELLTRGAPEEILDRLLLSLGEDRDLKEAIELARSRFASAGQSGSVARFLASRGFDESVIEQALAVIEAPEPPERA